MKVLKQAWVADSNVWETPLTGRAAVMSHPLGYDNNLRAGFGNQLADAGSELNEFLGTFEVLI